MPRAPPMAKGGSAAPGGHLPPNEEQDARTFLWEEDGYRVTGMAKMRRKMTEKETDNGFFQRVIRKDYGQQRRRGGGAPQLLLPPSPLNQPCLLQLLPHVKAREQNPDCHMSREQDT